jgi:hypothetical protein
VVASIRENVDQHRESQWIGKHLVFIVDHGSTGNRMTANDRG